MGLGNGSDGDAVSEEEVFKGVEFSTNTPHIDSGKIESSH